MKLESLKGKHLKKQELPKEKLIMFTGGKLEVGTETPGGTTTAPHGGHGKVCTFNYSYDSNRGGGSITYHGRSNVTNCE